MTLVHCTRNLGRKEEIADTSLFGSVRVLSVFSTSGQPWARIRFPNGLITRLGFKQLLVLVMMYNNGYIAYEDQLIRVYMSDNDRYKRSYASARVTDLVRMKLLKRVFSNSHGNVYSLTQYGIEIVRQLPNKVYQELSEEVE